MGHQGSPRVQYTAFKLLTLCIIGKMSEDIAVRTAQSYDTTGRTGDFKHATNIRMAAMDWNNCMVLCVINQQYYY